MSENDVKVLHYLWQRIRARCYRESHHKYHLYGARGIRVYEPWRESFARFREDVVREIGYKPSGRHSFDRVDNDGDYAPGNIRWATNVEQCANTRKARLIDGVSTNTFAKRHGVEQSELSRRMRLGHDPYDALAVIRACRSRPWVVILGEPLYKYALRHGVDVGRLRRCLLKGMAPVAAVSACRNVKRGRPRKLSAGVGEHPDLFR